MTDPATPAPTRDLVALRKIAEAATQGPWFGHDFSAPEIAPSPVAADVTVSCDHPATITVAYMGGGLHGFKNVEQARKDAAHIAAFDPPTVLWLIELATEAEDFAGQIAAYHKGEAYFHGQAVMERENKLTAERDADILRAKSAEQDWANREADTLRLKVVQEDCQRALADALAHASREASLRIKTESYFLGKTATLETERDALRAQLQTAREALGWFLEDGRFRVGVGGNPNVVKKMIADALESLAAIKKETQP